ncbi:MAG TPA: DnaJ domain-containing protein [Kiritimatiellia bacterium]|nr:DnaJ domain-containing protein [Kiritimatiellia bacterium]HMO98350.1 DnaJ domain-containing protein [Kiritimatiellia bacterium]
MEKDARDHYATLGLLPDCSDEDIRKAYRMLAKNHHPDRCGESPETRARIQTINEAYHVLGNQQRRRAYDAACGHSGTNKEPTRTRPFVNIQQDVHLHLQDFLRGIALEVTVNDPAHPAGTESYRLVVPAETAPGTRFRIKRAAPFDSGFVTVRVKARPDRWFKPKGGDVRCDVNISARRAASGGVEAVRGITGKPIHVTVPPNVARGYIVRVPGEGLPKPRGGRGDLLVRIMYRPDVRISRTGPAPTPAPQRRRLLK